MTDYHPRLYASLIRRGVRFIRRSYDHIDDLISDFSGTTAVFNCTGLGARTLGGVEDKNLHPTKVRSMVVFPEILLHP